MGTQHGKSISLYLLYSPYTNCKSNLPASRPIKMLHLGWPVKQHALIWAFTYTVHWANSFWECRVKKKPSCNISHILDYISIRNKDDSNFILIHNKQLCMLRLIIFPRIPYCDELGSFVACPHETILIHSTSLHHSGLIELGPSERGLIAFDQ